MSRPMDPLVLVLGIDVPGHCARVRFLETVDGLRREGDEGVVDVEALGCRAFPGNGAPRDLGTWPKPGQRYRVRALSVAERWRAANRGKGVSA